MFSMRAFLLCFLSCPVYHRYIKCYFLVTPIDTKKTKQNKTNVLWGWYYTIVLSLLRTWYIVCIMVHEIYNVHVAHS